MFCNKCGAQLPDGSAFCGNCGNRLVPVAPAPVAAPVAPAPVAAPVAPAPVAAPVAPAPVAAPVAPAPAPKKKSNAALIAIIAVIAALAVTVGVLFATGVFGGKKAEEGTVPNNAADVAISYAEAFGVDNHEGMFALALADLKQKNIDSLMRYYDSEEAFFAAASDEIGDEIKSWNDYFKADYQDTLDMLEADYSGYKITAIKGNVQELNDSELADIISYLRANFAGYYDTDIEEDIDAGCIIEVELKLTCDDGVEAVDYELYVVRCDGKWKVIDMVLINTGDANDGEHVGGDIGNDVDDLTGQPSGTPVLPPSSNTTTAPSPTQTPVTQVPDAVAFSLGTVDGSYYTNHFADLRLPLSSDWVDQGSGQSNIGLYVQSQAGDELVQVLFFDNANGNYNESSYLTDYCAALNTQYGELGITIDFDYPATLTVADHYGVGVTAKLTTSAGENLYEGIFVYAVDDYLVILNITTLAMDGVGNIMNSFTAF